MKLNAIELPPRAPGLSRTLVLLHGYGADERDLLPIAHELDPRFRAVSLQGPIALSGPMRAWFNLSQDAQGRISFVADEARGAVQAAIDAVEEIAKGSRGHCCSGSARERGIALGVALLRPSSSPECSRSREWRVPWRTATTPPRKAPHPAGVRGPRGPDPLLPISLGRGLRDELIRLGVAVVARVPDGTHGHPRGARGCQGVGQRGARLSGRGQGRR